MRRLVHQFRPDPGDSGRLGNDGFVSNERIQRKLVVETLALRASRTVESGPLAAMNASVALDVTTSLPARGQGGSEVPPV